jgi:hypothetical protein
VSTVGIVFVVDENDSGAETAADALDGTGVDSFD